MNSADSIGLGAVWAAEPGDRLMFTQNSFAAGEETFQARSLFELLAYARLRARHNDQLTVQAVTFNSWRNGGLCFGPLYVRRTADDFGGKARYFTGQGYYACGRGLVKIGWGPRVELKPGSE